MFIVTWHLRHLVLLAFVHQKSHRLKGSWKWCTFIKLHVSPARTPQALVLSLRCPQIFSTLVWSNLRTLQSRSTLNCQHQIFWMPTELAHWNALRCTNQLSKFIILNFDYYKLPIRLIESGNMKWTFWISGKPIEPPLSASRILNTTVASLSPVVEAGKNSL